MRFCGVGGFMAAERGGGGMGGWCSRLADGRVTGTPLFRSIWIKSRLLSASVAPVTSHLRKRSLPTSNCTTPLPPRIESPETYRFPRQFSKPRFGDGRNDPNGHIGSTEGHSVLLIGHIGMTGWESSGSGWVVEQDLGAVDRRSRTVARGSMQRGRNPILGL